MFLRIAQGFQWTPLLHYKIYSICTRSIRILYALAIGAVLCFLFYGLCAVRRQCFKSHHRFSCVLELLRSGLSRFLIAENPPRLSVCDSIVRNWLRDNCAGYINLKNTRYTRGANLTILKVERDRHWQSGSVNWTCMQNNKIRESNF